MPPYVSLLFAALSETEATQLNTSPLFSPTTPPATLLLLTEPETVQLRISAKALALPAMPPVLSPLMYFDRYVQISRPLSPNLS